MKKSTIRIPAGKGSARNPVARTPLLKKGHAHNDNSHRQQRCAARQKLRTRDW